MKKITSVILSMLLIVQVLGGVILTPQKSKADPAIDQTNGSWSDTFLDNNPTNSAQDGISSSTGVEAVFGNLRLKNIPWYNFSWDYRAPITITNLSSGSLANYQELLVIDTAALIGAGKMQADGDDIIFTDYASSAVYDYWIESGINTSATKIWVKIPSLLIGTTIIQMYYGNSGATATSSFANTMENPPVVWWNKTYDSGFDDHAYGIAVDSNNNVIVAGYVTNADTTTDLFITKYDTNGNVVTGWPKTYDGGVVADDVATSIAIDSNNNIIVAGRSSNGTDFDFIIIKYNPDGTPFWSGLDGVGGIAKIYDGGDIDSANGVAVDLSDDSIIVTGDTTIPATWNTNFLTIRYDSAGTLVWSKTYDNTSVTDSWDKSNALAVDSDDNIIVAGYSQNNDVTYENDFYAIKYDLLGNVVWEKRYANGLNNEANGVTVDSIGDVIATGRSTDASFYDDFRTIKYSSSDGTILWNNIYNTGDNDIANSAATDRNNNVIIAGQIGGDANWNYGILKYDSSGNVIWNTTYDSGGTPDSGQAVAIDSDNNILITGYNTASDFYTIKYSEHKYADAVPTYLFGAELAKAVGTATSVDIIPTTIYGWTQFSWTDSKPAGTNIVYTLEAWDGSAWVAPALTDALSNANGSFTNSPVDLSGLDHNTYTKIKLTADFSSTDVTATPLLSDWSVTWDAADPDIALLAADKAALVDGLIQGANVDLDNITLSLTNPLPATGTVNGSTITWASSNTGVVSDDGQTITRPTFADGNATVTLTATLTKGAVTDTKDFTLTVLRLSASTIKNITSFNFTSPAITGTVNNTAHTVALTVPYGTGVTALAPTIVVSANATISPLSGIAQNFSSPVAYTVTAEDATTQAYTVTVTVAAAPSSGGGGGGGGGSYTPTSSVTNTSFSINSGAAVANNSAVALTIGATNAAKMAISNSSDFSGAAWEAYAIIKAWTLTSGDGVKTVYIKFQDSAGIATAAISDTITLDTSIIIPSYPDGALLKSSSEEKVYVIKNGEKEWIKTAEEFIAGGYKWEDIKIISSEELDAIPVRGSGGSAPAPNPPANPTGYADGTLLKIADSFKVYVMIDQKKKWIATPEVFETLGYKWGSIAVISKAELYEIPDYEDNLIRAVGDYKVYLVVSGVKRHIPNPEIFLDYGFAWGDVKDVPQAAIDKYSRGYLIRESRQEKIYYLSSSGVKKWIPSPEIFASYNNKWEDIQVISKKEMDSYATSNLMKLIGSPDVYLIENNVKRLIPSAEIFNKNKYDWTKVLEANKLEFDWYKTGAPVK